MVTATVVGRGWLTAGAAIIKPSGRAKARKRSEFMGSPFLFGEQPLRDEARLLLITCTPDELTRKPDVSSLPVARRRLGDKMLRTGQARRREYPTPPRTGARRHSIRGVNSPAS